MVFTTAFVLYTLVGPVEWGHCAPLLGIRTMDAVVATILLVHQGGTAMSEVRFHYPLLECSRLGSSPRQETTRETTTPRPQLFYAPIGRRLSAHLLDRFLFYGSLFFVVIAEGVIGSTHISWAGISIILGYLIWFCYAAAKGTTPGKRLTGLKIVTRDGQTANFFTVIIRETLGKLISSSLFGIGFIWAFHDFYDRTWHDFLCKTCVVEAVKHDTSTGKKEK